MWTLHNDRLNQPPAVNPQSRPIAKDPHHEAPFGTSRPNRRHTGQSHIPLVCESLSAVNAFSLKYCFA